MDHHSIPSAPNPAGDAGVLPEFRNLNLQDAPSPPADDELDIMTMERETAMKIVLRAVLALANATGDIPATPPLSRPGTPNSSRENLPSLLRGHRRTASRPATPIPADREEHHKVPLESAEASHDEPTHVTCEDVGAGSLPEHIQRANMARKFFSKTVPRISLEEYMNRIQQFCPLSTGVWLAAGSYILRLCILDKSVPLTPRTMHRLVLASLVAAMKALEDHRWPQERFAGVGGVDILALSRLEMCVEFLLSFDLQIFSPQQMTGYTVALQKAAHAAILSNKLPSTFHLRLSNPRLRQC